MSILGDLLATGLFFGIAIVMGLRLWRSFQRANEAWAPKAPSPIPVPDPDPDREIDDLRPGDPRLN